MTGIQCHGQVVPLTPKVSGSKQMTSKSLSKMAQLLIAICVVLFSVSGSLYADDTEIYRISNDRPKVLIVFDDSGSMNDRPSTGGSKKKLEIVKDVVIEAINKYENIDFGLLEFNSNGNRFGVDEGHHGGRVVHAIQSNMTDTQRAKLISLFGRDPKGVEYIQSGGSTPLCESTYEAYLYLYGQPLEYGNSWIRNEPVRDSLEPDLSAMDSKKPGSYKSPVTDCGKVSMIILTDGFPQNDTDASIAIKTLIGKDPSNYRCVPEDQPSGYPTLDQGLQESCMPELAAYMFKTDIDDSIDGLQNVTTYTIGFDTKQDLLEDTASAGGGIYETANNADQLTKVLDTFLTTIEGANSVGFTSPALAVNSLTRTESRDAVFFSMFQPLDPVQAADPNDPDYDPNYRPNDWPGNIKKLKIRLDKPSDPNDPVVALLVDKNDDPALSKEGSIRGGDNAASTFWSDRDGPVVIEGGVGGVLAARDPSTRDIVTNTGSSDALEPFNSTNLNAEAYELDSPNELYELFGVSGENDTEKEENFEALIDWARGYELDGSGDTRSWILADMLHSQPLVVNYGGPDPNDPDLRIVVGTNGGFFHMFNNEDGSEDWAFFPKELAPVLQRRAQTSVDSKHVYGIDASPVLYTIDVNRDGTISAAAGDKAHVYFGLRRGGRALYALDISNPDAPKFLWKIDNDKDGFGELGYTWSEPMLAKIPGYVDDDSGLPMPVLIFGGGYDPVKDSKAIVSATTPDSMGRALYIVDALTGDLVWSVTPQLTSDSNLQEVTLIHSVAGEVNALDSNGDELIDRIYFADTGGNVWRVDLPGNCHPGDSGCQSNTPTPPPWSIVKLAQMNGDTVATDRRFFSAPDVVRTSDARGAFDAVLIGSGDRTNPNSTDVLDQFYMIRDGQISPYLTPAPTDCGSPPAETRYRCKLPITPAQLHDVTENLIQTGTPEQQKAEALALANPANHGWRIDFNYLNKKPGEKSLARSLTIAGKVYFTTFVPGSIAADLCGPTKLGTGYLYAVNLIKRITSDDKDLERSWIIGALIPDTPAPFIGSDGEIRLLLPLSSGGGGALTNPFLTGASLRRPYGSYWYREDY